ncbi:MAG: GAF domain-containing protein [Oscillatoriales cyanobacterium C42_A2020_001]|nr:GAF domain-containing protein [Leptolyngbyaceae cyanobacterium C42_A2020_001]
MNLHHPTPSPSDHPSRILFEAAIDAMLIADDDGRYVDANPAACHLFGLPREQLLGRRISDFAPPNFDFSQAWQSFQHQKQSRGEFQLVRLDGSIRTVKFAATANFLPHKHLSVLRDITDRKQAEIENYRLQQELEQRVQERTQALEQINAELRQEVHDRKQAEIELNLRNNELRTLCQISQITLNAPSLQSAFQAIVEEISTTTQFPIVAIELYDPTKQLMQFVGVKGIPLPEGSTMLEVPVCQTLSGMVATTGQLIVKTYSSNETKICNANQTLNQLGIRTFLCIPMRVEQEILGTLSLAHSDVVPISEQFLTWGNSLANYVASLINRKRTEEQLRLQSEILQKNQQWLDQFSRQAPANIYTIVQNPDGYVWFEYLSAAAEAIHETPLELLKQNAAIALLNQVHPDDLQEYREACAQSAQNLSPFLHEWRIITPSGKVKWLRAASQPERRNNGAIAWHGVLQDITERKLAEESLHQQTERERLLNTITQHIRQSLELDEILNVTVTDVLTLLQCDRVLTYRICPSSVGKVETEALAQGQSSLLHEVYITSCHPKCEPLLCQQPRVINDFSRDAAIDCPLDYLLASTAKAQLTVPILHQNQLWGFLIAHQCSAPRNWQQWEIDLLIAIANQVSIAIHQSYLYQQVQQFNIKLEREVQDRTAELQQSLLFESLLKRITDSVRDSLDEDQILQTAVQELAHGLGVACCDAGLYSDDNTICTITHECTHLLTAAVGRTLKITENTLIHLQLLKGQAAHICLIAPDQLRQNACRYTVFACPITEGQRVLGNLWLFKPQGEWFNDLEVRLIQQVANQCAIALRQSRLYQAAQTQVRELERLNRLKDDFLSTVSHELRTPMSNIKMATQMLEIVLKDAGFLELNRLNFSEEANHTSQYFQILNTECNREITLINDLLDLSRLEADADPLLLSTIRLQDWIPAIAEPFEQKIAQHQQQLHFQIPDDLPPLTTDLKYIERILAELLQNACKYTPAGETIAIAAQQFNADFHCPYSIQITVSNTGVEIPSTELTRVFDRFYRIPNNDPWRHGGTGLGLALVKKLVDRLQGAITVQSANSETRFTVEFPLQIETSLRL